MRSVRLTTSAGAVLGTAALALALTACGGGDSTSSAAGTPTTPAAPSAPTTAPSAGSSAAPSSAPTGAPAAPAATHEPAQGSGAAPTKAAGGSGSGSAGSADGGCAPGATTVKLQETGGTIPAILLTVTNTGSRECAVYNAPFVSDPATGMKVPVNKDSVPQAVVELAPGHTAYASIGLSEHPTERAKTLAVTLATATDSRLGAPTTVTSPGPAGLGLDSQSEVTYWQATQDLALQ